MNTTWDLEHWKTLERRTSARAGSTRCQDLALDEMCRAGRSVLQTFSSSFFLVTRFLPRFQRSRVDLIYAAVRYPDEIADTFPLNAAAKLQAINEWQTSYENALILPDPVARLRAGTPWILAGFAQVVREFDIPHGHYRDFLRAMCRDVAPQPFASLLDLITEYIYGSAIVVGYFLAHVYGAAPGETLTETYSSAADLAIALQLTNFARDVAEDHRRGRLYIPLDMLAAEGLTAQNYMEARHSAARHRAVCGLAKEAETLYKRAATTVDVFSAETRPAIRACIDVYRRLNGRILRSDAGSGHRQSVPAVEKLRALPPSKYWRLPLAYLGGL